MMNDFNIDAEDAQDMFIPLLLISAEFQSDPTSVQCFDLRVVQAAKDIVERVEEKYPDFVGAAWNRWAKR